MEAKMAVTQNQMSIATGQLYDQTYFDGNIPMGVCGGTRQQTKVLKKKP